jgi:hypothetical protein
MQPSPASTAACRWRPPNRRRTAWRTGCRFDALPFGAGGGVSIQFNGARQGAGFWYMDSQFAGNCAMVYGPAKKVLGTFELIDPHPTEWQFVGFVSGGFDIARIEVSIGAADRVTLDDVRFSAPVPEPATCDLGAGAGGRLAAGSLAPQGAALPAHLTRRMALLLPLLAGAASALVLSGGQRRAEQAHRRRGRPRPPPDVVVARAVPARAHRRAAQGCVSLASSGQHDGRDGVAYRAGNVAREAGQCVALEHSHAGRTPGRGRDRLWPGSDTGQH